MIRFVFAVLTKNNSGNNEQRVSIYFKISCVYFLLQKCIYGSSGLKIKQILYVIQQIFHKYL